MVRTCWPRTVVAFCTVAVHAVVASIPQSLHFVPEPRIFAHWADDGKHLTDETPVCAAKGGGSSCSQTALPDKHVEERIDSVRDYYNSDSVIRQMSSDGPAEQSNFHTEFSVHDVDDGQYMLVLAGLRSSKRPYRLKTLSKKFNVLDYGCGLGTFARSVAQTGCCNVSCVNIAPKQVEKARSLTPLGDVLFEAYDGHKFPYADGFFDVIFFQESYSTLTPNQCEIAREFSRVLKPGGRVVGLDWFVAPGLSEDEYRYWVGPVNLAWASAMGSLEGVTGCFRQAGLERIHFVDTAWLGGIPQAQRPRNDYLNADARLIKNKYGTTRGQLSMASFSERHRHMYGMEASELGLRNEMFSNGYLVGYKPRGTSTTNTSVGDDM